MAQNVIIANVEYSDVPAVDLTKVSGGTARFVDTSDANAVAANILSGYTAYVDGSKVNGDMDNNGAVSETLTTQGDEYVIPAGYHNGSGVVTASIMDGTLSASAAASGTVIGTTSSSYPITITATAGVADPGYVEDTTTETATITRYVQTETKTATPTTSSQTINPSSNKLLSSVTVNAMPTGTLGAITATKGSVSNHSVTVTPKMAAGTAGYNAMAATAGTAVTVSASELVSGSTTYTANGTYDVTNISSAVVNVSSSETTYRLYVDATLTEETACGVYLNIENTNLGISLRLRTSRTWTSTSYYTLSAIMDGMSIEGGVIDREVDSISYVDAEWSVDSTNRLVTLVTSVTIDC